MTLPAWLEREPVVAVCGRSGSGKTTLLERVIPRLAAEGLSVGAVKHDAHGFEIDRPGKDSDRLFRAGAEVVLRGPEEVAVRSRPEAHTALEAVLAALLARHDLVLVEGHSATPLPKVWLAGPGGDGPPPGTAAVAAVLAWDGERESALLAVVRERLAAAWRERPLLGGLLVGGASRRMGRPKQLLELGGRTLAETAAGALAPHVERVVLLGGGTVPAALERCQRLPDPPGLAGPLAGILAALRWAPRAAWAIAACDLPAVGPEAVAWLVGQRRPGRRAVLPRLPAGRVEPLLAVYEPHAAAVLEALAARGRLAPRELAGAPGVATPEPPPELAGAWADVDTPGDLHRLGPRGR